MSDTPQGPDWFQASDGKWYPPSPQGQAQGQKKSGCMKPGCLIVAAAIIGLFVLIIVIAALAGGGDSKKAGQSTAAASCAGKSYPDQQESDICADASNAVAIDGVTVTATPFTAQTDALGGKALCTNVTIQNTSKESKDYNVLDFKVQTPGGVVATTSSLSLAGTLDSGTLIAGATKAGAVCTDDKGEKGQYVVIYKPNPFKAERGTWLFNV